MRIAYFSPLPPQPSGISDYSADLIPALLEYWDITLFVEQVSIELPRDLLLLPIRSLDSFAGAIVERCNMCVYQMGNNIHFHKGIFETLLRYPGVVVLHDPNLYGFHLDYAMQQKCPRTQLVRDFGFGYGDVGIDYARQLFLADGLRQNTRYPLAARIAQTSIGVIVHSEHARRIVLRDSPNARVAVTQQPVSIRKRTISKSLAKEQLGLPADTVLLSSFGYASPNKHIHSVIEILPKLRDAFPKVHYAIVGQPIVGYDLAKLISDRGLEQFVHLTGYVDKTLYTNYLLATDIGINLRFPTTGETSAALLDMMSAGIPCIVADVDAFSELPDDAVVKLKPDAEIEKNLILTLTSLICKPEWQKILSENAQRYILSEANPTKVAATYASFVAESIHLSFRDESRRLSL
jgi:glycosyltransferase involved in cell wall biosynthesis